MDEDRELSGTKTLRLFPLSGVVFFPHCVLPLHIFEPRYRQMTEDALADDRLVTIVMARPPGERKGAGPPKLEEFGCVGRIVQCERLPDGRFNFLLVGLKRVRLLEEFPSGKLYRTAEAQIIEDVEELGERTAPLRRELVSQFRALLDRSGGIDPEFESLIASDMPLGVLADIVAHALAPEPEVKQRLLAEPRVEPRIDQLIAWIAGRLAQGPRAGGTARGFQPPFSEN